MLELVIDNNQLSESQMWSASLIKSLSQRVRGRLLTWMDGIHDEDGQGLSTTIENIDGEEALVKD